MTTRRIRHLRSTERARRRRRTTSTSKATSTYGVPIVYNPRPKPIPYTGKSKLTNAPVLGASSSTGKSLGAQKLIESMQPKRTTSASNNPYAGLKSEVYAARGLAIQASSTGWDTKPIRTFDGNKVYKHAATPTFYIIGPEGQYASYQYRHKRLWHDGLSDKTTLTIKYPSWFDKETIDYIEKMGGLTSDPYYSRS